MAKKKQEQQAMDNLTKDDPKVDESKVNGAEQPAATAKVNMNVPPLTVKKPEETEEEPPAGEVVSTDEPPAGDAPPADGKPPETPPEPEPAADPPPRRIFLVEIPRCLLKKRRIEAATPEEAMAEYKALGGIVSSEHENAATIIATDELV